MNEPLKARSRFCGQLGMAGRQERKQAAGQEKANEDLGFGVVMEDMESIGWDGDEVEVPEHLHDYVELNKNKLECGNCGRGIADLHPLERGGQVYCSNECMWTKAFGGCTTKKKKVNTRKPGVLTQKVKGPSLLERAKTTISTSNGVDGNRNAMFIYHTMMSNSPVQCTDQDKAR